jgi:hypothetical protein
MPRIEESDLGTIPEFRRPVVLNLADARHNTRRILRCEQGESRLVFAEAHFVGESGIFLLKMRRVKKADFEQFGRDRGGQDYALKPSHENRQHA